MNEDNAIIPYEDVEIITKEFEDESIEFISKDEELWVTARTLGMALEYNRPRLSIMKIFERHKDEIEPYSAVVTLTTAGKPVETRIFNEKGVTLITLFSRKNKAKMFRNWLSNVAIEIRKQGFYIEPSMMNNIEHSLTMKKQALMLLKLARKFKDFKQEAEEQAREIKLLKEKLQEIDDDRIILDETLKHIRDYVNNVYQQYGISLWKELKGAFEYSKLERLKENRGRAMLLYMKKKYPLVE